MEQFITALPHTFLGWLSTILVIVGGVVLLFNRIRNSDLQTLRESNNDLRNAHKDNTRKILELEMNVQLLMDKVSIIESEKKTIQDLVIIALESYFEKNPTEAIHVKTAVQTKVTTKVG